MFKLSGSVLMMGGEGRLIMQEQQLENWTGPSSDAEQDKQSRTERMIKAAIDDHPAFDGVAVKVYAKGSYPNRTNVRFDSDVDVAVQCREVIYFDEATPGSDRSPGSPYSGVWSPSHLRSEVRAALVAKFGVAPVDSSGTTAIRVNASSSRVEADVVPCFDYRYYFSSGNHADGIRIYSTDGRRRENYPVQCLERGNAKNSATSRRYKKLVRIMKRVANEMEEKGHHKAVPSYFVESLVYNCPSTVFNNSSWNSRARAAIVHIWAELDGIEPTNEADRWLETNDRKFLFYSAQAWDRSDGRAFAQAAWSYMGFAE